MTEQQGRRSRREIVAAIVAIPTTMLCRTAAASDKMTKPQVAYQDTPNGIYSCGLCTLFVAPNACKVIEGEISKDGWCKAFATVD